MKNASFLEDVFKFAKREGEAPAEPRKINANRGFYGSASPSPVSPLSAFEDSLLQTEILAPASRSPAQLLVIENKLPCAKSPTRITDYIELTKPRITVMVLITVAVGYWLAATTGADLVVLLHVLIGTGLTAAGASALNQLLEKQTDSLMRRTENRPLPAGRLGNYEVLAFGLAAGIGGIVYLTATVQSPLCSALAAFTFLSYVLVYTPLKRITTLNTLIGAVPGALPPLIGWTAARSDFAITAVVLFLIVFLWQVPHFLAIAWMYREDYARAGLRMLPVVDKHGRFTALQMILWCACLLAVSLLPAAIGHAGIGYLLAALLPGGIFLAAALQFQRQRTTKSARGVLRASLIYLPVVLTLLLLSSAISF